MEGKPSATTDRHPVFRDAPSQASGALTSTAVKRFFDNPVIGRGRLIASLLLGPLLLACVALPFARHDVLRTVVAVSLLVLAGCVATLLALPRIQVEHQTLPFAVAVHLSLVAWLPLIYFFGTHGPVVGVVALVLFAYSLDADRWSSVAATLSVAIPHSALSALMASGAFPRLSLAQPDLYPRLEWINASAILTIYLTAFGLARLYRRRTERDLAELAEAGRMVAAREAVLREARQELQQAAGVGHPGRFTEQELGSFLLGHLLGRGGMGEVYAATHTTTGVAAAVKVLRIADVDAADLVRRFEREVAIVRRLSSPHVAQVFEVAGLEATLPYIAMELLEGRDCAQILRERTMTRDEVVDLVEQVGKGLVEAKRHDVVHRDIKPSNLFRQKDGTWKVLDFGIARLAGQGGTLTGGGLVGTVGYLAPEQLVSDASVTHRTDVHALAVVAYRALTGRPAFAKRDLADALTEVRDCLPPPPSALADVPGAVDDVLLIGMAKHPEDRFEDAMELASALRRAVRGEIYAELRERAQRIARRISWRTDESERLSDVAERTIRASRTRLPGDA